jgi:hypothetical protein
LRVSEAISKKCVKQEKRFFGWFNMFRVIKYLNHVHSGTYEKKPASDAAYELLKERGVIKIPDDPGRLLNCYRLMEKNG